MPYGEKPFGLNQVKLKSGATVVTLPVAQKLTLKERTRNGELSGDDKLAAVVSISEAFDWELEAGGISLDAYALLTGRTASESGTTPNLVNTLSVEGGKSYPYILIFGKSVGDDGDDIHVKIYKAKLMEISGEFADNAFLVTKCTGIAIGDSGNSDKILDFIQHETATTISTS